MKVSRKLVLCLALVVSVAMATGGTLAYLTDTDAEVNVFALGNVSIDLTEEFEQPGKLMPGVDTNKKVEIKNDGNNDAWVFATIAVPAQGGEDLLKLNLNPNRTKWDASIPVKSIVLEGLAYNLYTFLYTDALAVNETTETLLESVSLDPSIDYVDGKYVKVVKGATTPITNYDLSKAKVYVNAYAIQKENFADVVAGYNAYMGQWTTDGNLTEGNINMGANSSNTAVSNPENDEAFKEAATEDKEELVITLNGNVTYDVAAWAANGLGGASTKKITIIGNGHTIIFNQTDSDWNNIVTNNGAVLNIQNAHLTNSGYNNGPWNSHDLNFGCEVNLTNVTSDKAMAFKAGANLENVTINDAYTSDTYAIWIQPNGQTVTLNNCTIDMLACTDGRGIKIDEQYVTNPQKVTLNVSNTTIKTEEKSAIIVKSAAGADINLSNVDISGVAADPKHEVWVDEASKNYYDLVTVVGGTKVLEGDFTSLASGLYKEGNTYYVSSASGLKWLSNKTLTSNNSVAETAIINLEADIDMKNEAFSAVIAQRGDTLIFNGNGHTISNVEVVSGADDNTTGQASMFYVYPYSNLEVSNLTLANITVTSDAVDSGYAAAVVGYCEGTAKLTDVDVSNAKVNGVKSSGMLVGHLSGVLVATNCDMSGTVELVEFSEEPDGHYAGKYIGTLAGAAQLNYCTADVDVIGKLKAGNDGTIYGRKTEEGSLMN